MKIKTNRPKTRFSSRLALLRKEHSYSQNTFAKEFSEYSGRKPELTITTVSSWETGARIPDLATIISIARFFNTSIDYLIGLTNNVEGNPSCLPSDVPLDMTSSVFKIEDKDILKYDGCPIFVVFPNTEYENQWGLLDAANTTIIFKDMSIKLFSFIGEYYTYPRPADVHYSLFDLHPYTIQALMSVNKFWVGIKSSSEKVRQQYNGWWTHNENKTCIINPQNGLTLPYDGLGIGYNAYSKMV